MAFKDIEKLKEKVDKDPNSKLFVPLAEEYRKEGMIEEAVDVLRAGLERQPGYMSARVALGKIYLEKELKKEAREEFEKVIKSIPDNLYAQKKLAEIYRDSGEKDLAIKAYRTVLKLNSMDEDAGNNLKELEGSVEEAFAEEGFVLETTSLDEAVQVAEAIPEDASETIQEDLSAHGNVPEEVEAIPEDEDLDAFRQSLFGGNDETAAVHETTGREASGTDESLREQSVSEESYEIAEMEVAAESEIAPLPDEIQLAEIAPAEVTAEPETAHETEIASFLPGDDSEISAKGTPVPEQGMDITEGLREADRLISDGDYAAAMRMYKRVLISHPSEKKILQRLEELRALLKLTGKEKEALILNLTAFLDSVKKRQNGFSGSP